MKNVYSSILIVAGELFSKAIPFLLLPYFSRKYGPDGYGELVYVQVSVFLCSLLIGLSQDGAIARYFYVYGRRSIFLVVSSGLVLSSIVFVILAILKVTFGQNLSLIALVCAFSQVLISVQLAIRQAGRDGKGFFIINVTNGLLVLGLTFVFTEVYLLSHWSYFYSLAIANSVTAGFAFLTSSVNLAKVDTSVNKYLLTFNYVLGFGLPLVFHNLSFFMKGYMDRALIYSSYGAEQLGIYAAGYQLAAAYSVVLMGINKALVPYFYQALKDRLIERNKFFKYVNISIIIFWLPAFLFFTIPTEWFILVLGVEFEGVKYYASIFLLGLGFQMPYLILVNYLFYEKDNRFISMTSFFSASIHVFLVIIFSRQSLVFVPLSLCFSNLLMVMCLYTRVWRNSNLLTRVI